MGKIKNIELSRTERLKLDSTLEKERVVLWIMRLRILCFIVPTGLCLHSGRACSCIIQNVYS